MLMHLRKVVFPTFAALALVTALVACQPAGWSFPTGYDSFTAAQGYDQSGCTSFLSAAAVSLQSSKTDKAANLAAISAMVTRVMADHPDTQVIVFHEMCTSWLLDSTAPSAYFASVAETIPGPSTSSVAGIAAANNVCIVFGLAEKDGSSFYNTQALVRPDGSILTYRKRGLNEGDKANGCSPGQGVVTASIGGVQVTFAICSDYQDEAVIKDLSTSTAPVVLVSLVTATRLNNQVDFFARALGKWVVYANGGGEQSGGVYPGNIFIADPTGTLHAPAEGPGTYSWFHMGVR
jgi:(R)-amidase